MDWSSNLLTGCTLDGLVVTNVGRDHLDFHGTEAAYRSKITVRRLVTPRAPLVLNADDGVMMILLE